MFLLTAFRLPTEYMRPVGLARGPKYPRINTKILDVRSIELGPLLEWPVTCRTSLAASPLLVRNYG